MGHGQLIYNGSSNYKLLDFTQKIIEEEAKLKAGAGRGAALQKQVSLRTTSGLAMPPPVR